MAFEQRDNEGAIFRNQKKTKDTHPGMTGKAMIGGVMYWVSAWTKERQNGEKYITMSFKPVEAQQEKPKQMNKDQSGFDDFEDSIPF